MSDHNNTNRRHHQAMIREKWLSMMDCGEVPYSCNHRGHERRMSAYEEAVRRGEELPCENFLRDPRG